MPVRSGSIHNETISNEQRKGREIKDKGRGGRGKWGGEMGGGKVHARTLQNNQWRIDQDSPEVHMTA